MDPYGYLNRFDRFGNKGGYRPGLKRIGALLEPFNHPENKINTIHVAGSNGKGSTIAFLNSIYQQAGYRVGMYISPHILSFNERMQVNGCCISDRELTELISLIKPVVEEVSSRLGRPSFFEVVTAVAFLYFYHRQLDILLLEVGLGGRLDATNVIKSPMITVITGISLEHTSILGSTMEQIAGEKAGIIKNGRPVITAVMNEKAFKTIEKIAREKSTVLIHINDFYSYNLEESSLEGMAFSLKYRNAEAAGGLPEGNYFISMAGSHQVRNAVLALGIIDKLRDELPVTRPALRDGLEKASMPGRMEIVQREPLLLLDGAHNVEGIESLVSFLQEIRRDKQPGLPAESIEEGGKLYQYRDEMEGIKTYVIFAVLGDKDVEGMISELARLKNMRLIISKNSNNRAVDPAAVVKIARKIRISYRVAATIKNAVKQVYNTAGRNDIIVVTGSLYTVAEAKDFLEV
ncbi:MAG: bifunctional folylpolyglutamate synthase/dihydrofolate synthase [Halanaerobiales bacterium]